MAVLYYKHNLSEKEAREAAYFIEARARYHGMVIDSKQCFPLGEEQLAREPLGHFIAELRDKNGCDFVLAFATGSIFHDILKSTEVATGAPTQQVKPKTIRNLKSMTADNIVLKLNLKWGGFNQYFQKLIRSPVDVAMIDAFQNFMKRTLVMGIHFSHPEKRSNSPSVCGYAFTLNNRGNVARGGFVFMKARTVVLNEQTLGKPFTDALKLYEEKNGFQPGRILVYRFGASPEEFQKIQTEECPNIARFTGEIKLTVIAVCRQHGTRLFKRDSNPRDKAPLQNVAPGTCIERQLIPGQSTNVMVSHRALQGTAKPTMYSTIFPPAKVNDLSENFLKNLTFAFCFMHEIVNSPISVPHVIRSAEQMAKRGSKLFYSVQPDIPPTDDEEYFANLTEALNPTK